MIQKLIPVGRNANKQKLLLAEIRRRIRAGELSPGERLPSYQEMQDEFSLTPVTVQRAVERMKQTGLVRSEAKVGLFVADRPPLLSDVTIVFPNHPGEAGWSPAYTSMAAALEDGRVESQWRIHTYHCRKGDDGKTEVPAALVERVERHMTRGIVFSQAPFIYENTPLLTEPDIPRAAVVSAPKDDVAAVYYDYDAFRRMAFERIAAMGRKRLAVLNLAVTPAGQAEDLQALGREMGLEVHRRWVQAVSHNQSQWARNAVEMIFHPGQDVVPDALLLMDDTMAPFATEGLAHLGLGAEEDVLVLSLANVKALPELRRPARLLAFDGADILTACLERLEEPQDAYPGSLRRVPPKFLE